MSLQARLQKGIRAAQAGDAKRAEVIFKSILKAEPENPDALHFLGMVRRFQGRTEAAVALIRRSLAADAGNPSAHSNLGNMLRELGEDEEAYDCYRAALDLDPLNVDALNNIATLYRAAGRFEDAEKILRHVIEIAPEMAQAHHNLGVCLAECDHHDAALSAYQESFRLGGDWINPVTVAKVMFAFGRIDDAEALLADYLTRHPKDEAVAFQLAAIRGEDIDRVNDTYVRSQFDRFAASFDAVLERLEYRAPQLVADAVAARIGAPRADLDILDLGCGTGLCGPLLAPFKRALVGIDLSPGMLAKAKLRGSYDALHAAELQAFLEKQRKDSFDVITCVDTLVYIGVLDRTIMGAARALRPGGAFVATVEKLDTEDRDYKLEGTGRYRHSRTYLERLATEAGLSVGGIGEDILRKESRKPVAGYVFELLNNGEA